MSDTFDSPITIEHSDDQAAEFFRMTISKLSELGLPPSPLYYSLIYTYICGNDEQINKAIDERLQDDSLDFEAAKKLFFKFITLTDSNVVEELRSKVMETLNQSLHSLSKLSGTTNKTNLSLKKHIDTLNNSNKNDLASVISNIIHETTSLLHDTEKFEDELEHSTGNLQTLKEELLIARSEALTDALTGLHNRHSLNKQIELLINDRRLNRNFIGKGFSLLIVDIDHFKDVNDNYGHIIGDKVLKAFANMLQTQTRDTDFVSRFGGEEFVILLPNTSLNNAFRVAEHIRTAVEKMRIKQPKNNDTVIHTITASFGVGIYRDGETAEELIDRCDKALYRAKHAGRNRSMIAQ